MTSRKLWLVFLFGLLLVMTLACGQSAAPTAIPMDTAFPQTPVPTPDIEATVSASVKATPAAMPTATSTVTPIPTPVPTATPPPPLVLESWRCSKDHYGWAWMSVEVRNVSKKALGFSARGSWYTPKDTLITEHYLWEGRAENLGDQGVPPDQVFFFQGMVEANPAMAIC